MMNGLGMQGWGELQLIMVVVLVTLTLSGSCFVSGTDLQAIGINALSVLRQGRIHGNK